MTDARPAGESHAGEGGRHFPSTCWSRFTGAKSPEAVQELARRYWRPIHTYIRRVGDRSDEDARDLTQDFFVWMMETDFLSKADPSRGRFRSFVKVVLKRYLAQDDRHERRLKRGGDRTIISLDSDAGASDRVGLVDPSIHTPDEALDDSWRNELLTRAREIVHAELQRDGRELTYRIFEDYCLVDSPEIDYRAVAAKHGLKEGDVLNHLRYARKRFRNALKDLVSETVEGETDLLEEWSSLFADKME